jgi:hypothetical protein
MLYFRYLKRKYYMRAHMCFCTRLTLLLYIYKNSTHAYITKIFIFKQKKKNKKIYQNGTIC